MDLSAGAGLAPDTLDGRVGVVTGAASGIGRAIVETLLYLGVTVVAIDQDGDRLMPEGSDPMDGRLIPRAFDLCALEDIDGLVGDITANHGPVTILVNAAGVNGKPLLETTISDWEHIVKIDLTAPFVLIQSVGRRMVEAGHGGNIVNIGSSSAHRALRSGTAYGAAKAGLESLTRTAAGELGPHGVNVNLVAPGVTRTPLTLRAIGGDAAMNDQVRGDGPLHNLLGRFSEPEDVAAVVGFLCLPGARQITGQVIHTSGGAVVASG